MPTATAHQMTFLDAVEASAPKRPTVSAAAFADDGLPPPTHDQVYYWRELAGAITLRGAEGMPDDAWPADLNPTKTTLKQLQERQLVVRRGHAWHLRRHWYSRLQALRQRAVERPALSPAERPAPDLPTYAELKAFEALCLYLDTTPKCRARLPFVGWAARIERVTDAASIEGEVPMTLLKLMRHYKLVRHTSSCEWALSPTWRDRLQLFWRGVNTALREYIPPELAPRFPRSLVAAIDTWHLNWLVDDALPAQLRDRLDTWQQQAREAESEAETDLSYDGSPLLMYRWGTKAESGGGVPWGYVLLNPSLRLLIRKAPLGGIVAQARLGSECLWRRTAKGSLDELTLLMKRLWRRPVPFRRGKAAGSSEMARWQVSQIHLAVDVAHAPLAQEQAERYVSRSRSQAVYHAAQAEIAQLLQAVDGDEYAECLLKARFLTEPAEEFALLETLLWHGRYRRLQQHLQRLKHSATYFGYPFEPTRIRTALRQQALAFAPGQRYKVRLTLARTGALACASSRIAEERPPSRATIAVWSEHTDSHDRFLYHKTTNRARYDVAYQRAVQAGHADVIFLNERDEITEGAISNIFVRQGEWWLTPPISCGLLNGVVRQHVLQTSRHAREAVLHLQDLQTAEEIAICNAIKGWRRVTLQMDRSLDRS